MENRQEGLERNCESSGLEDPTHTLHLRLTLSSENMLQQIAESMAVSSHG